MSLVINDLMEVSRHFPVMAEEVLFWLVQEDSRTYLDCTVGYSGHAEKLLKASGPASRLIGLDHPQRRVSSA